MKNRIIIISATAALFYTILLLCFGVFGNAAASAVLSVVLTVGKWILVTAGYVFVIWLPFRVWQARQLDAKAKEQYKEVEKQIEQLKQKNEQEKIEEAILKAYQKAEDSI